jgi:hypothetical protein
VNLEWGAAGVRQLAPKVGCIVVLDVISCSIWVGIAVERSVVVPGASITLATSGIGARHRAYSMRGRSM